jgi:hypothetical protein
MTIFEDMMLYPSSHKRECLFQNRCICGQYERQNADFEARLKRAMERCSTDICNDREPA